MEHTINFVNNSIVTAIKSLLPNYEEDTLLIFAIRMLHGIPCNTHRKIRNNMRIILANELAKYAFTEVIDRSLIQRIVDRDKDFYDHGSANRIALPPHQEVVELTNVNDELSRRIVEYCAAWEEHLVDMQEGLDNQ